MKQNFSTPYSRPNVETPYSQTGGVSITVPNQALSVREILNRFARGTPPSMRQPSFDDEFVPDITRMDFVERDNFQTSLEEQIADIKAETAKRKKEAAEQAAKIKEQQQAVPNITPTPKEG